ncbi:cytochrome P450 [Coprinopsis sp. MPI-PUGE-AT-0042]|nr:cytochrome P450 [Coprinopsis sp. MPI-PUGE-AT-0042]
MFHLELSTAEIFAIPLFTVIIWATLKRAFRRRPFAMLKGPEGGTFLLGHISKLVNPKEGFQFQERVVQEHDQVAKLGGTSWGKLASAEPGLLYLTNIQSETLLVSDPKALHYILVKCHDVDWDEGENFLTGNDAAFGPGVLSTHGHEHKRQRKVLNSVFSTSHIRNMASIFDENTSKLAETLSKIVGEEKKEVEVFDWMARGALEIIGQGGFGYSFDSLSEHGKPHPFAASVKILLRLLNETLPIQLFVLPLVRKYNIGGKRIQRFVMKNLTWGAVRELVDVVGVMHRTSLEIYDARKQSLELESDHVPRKDILSALMKANASREAGDKMTDEEIIAQISSFNLCWDGYNIQETLRMYPPAPLAGRTAKKDTIIPLLTPIMGTDGNEVSEIFVPGGTDIFVSILGTNRSTKLWGSDAGEWKPERWLNELPKSLIDAKVPGVYSHVLTFAGGGRSCIGLKFAELELKSMILNLLDRLKFSPAEKKILWTFGGLVSPGVDIDVVQTRNGRVSTSGMLRLPTERHLAVFCLLARNSEDIVALRQTCKALYEVEKKHHAAIWKLCTQSLIDQAALFPPTFTWRSPSSKLQEQIARRAFCFRKALYEYQNAKLTASAPRHSLELSIPEGFSDLALLPGGRFLLGINCSTIALFDLALYYESGINPIQIASFECSTRLRLMFAYPTDPDGIDAFDDYNVGDNDDYSFLIEVHDISFANDELVHKMYGPLPLGRDSCDIYEHDLYTMSGDYIGAILDSRNALVWNYIDNTYQLFTLENHETEKPSDILLTKDRFIIFSVKKTEEDGNKTLGYQAGEMTSYEVQPFERLSLAEREVLPVPNWRSPTPAPFTNSFRQTLPLSSKGLKGLSPGRSSKALWGYSDRQYNKIPYPLYDYLTKEDNGGSFQEARRFYDPEKAVDTHWIRLDIAGSQHTTGTASLAAVAHAAQMLPLPEAYWCNSMFGRRASDGGLVSISQWERHRDSRSTKDRALVICASVSRIPSGAADPTTGAVSESRAHLIPFETYTESLKNDANAWDFCPLSGIMVMQHGLYRESTIQIHDYVRGYISRHK